MGHFADQFRIKIVTETGKVRLSFKSSDNRVDEHILDVRDFNAACQETDTGWCGTDDVSTKKIGHEVLLSIKESHNKRILYRLPYDQWRLVVETFVQAVRSSGIFIQPNLIKDKPELVIPIQQIASSVADTIMPKIRQEFLEMKEALSSIRVSAPVEQPKLDDNFPVFIPEGLVGLNITGDAGVKTKTQESTGLDDALQALKNLKGEQK